MQNIQNGMNAFKKCFPIAVSNKPNEMLGENLANFIPLVKNNRLRSCL